MFSKKKIFCIGLNKTGTTSIEKLFREFKLSLGNQAKGELLIHDWYNRDFDKIIKFCNTAEAFQDIPFSLPITYIPLDQYFSEAKFILTVRDSAEQWYNSLTNFHAKLWADNSEPPNAIQLKEAKYRYKGFAYDANRIIFNTPVDVPYHKETLLDFYNAHIYAVKEYFRSKPNKLLIINVSKKDDYFKLCDFLEKEPIGDDFPWENKTKRKDD